MKKYLLITTVLVVAVGFSLFACSKQDAIIQVGKTDISIIFSVIDVKSGKPIPDAVIDLEIELRLPMEGGNNVKKAKLATNDRGMAAFYREDVMCEDLIRSLRKTRTTYDLTWGSFSISAKGYKPVKDSWLHTSKYEVTDSTYSDAGRRITHLLITVPLEKIKS